MKKKKWKIHARVRARGPQYSGYYNNNERSISIKRGMSEFSTMIYGEARDHSFSWRRRQYLDAQHASLSFIIIITIFLIPSIRSVDLFNTFYHIMPVVYVIPLGSIYTSSATRTNLNVFSVHFLISFFSAFELNMSHVKLGWLLSDRRVLFEFNFPDKYNICQLFHWCAWSFCIIG